MVGRYRNRSIITNYRGTNTTRGDQFMTFLLTRTEITHASTSSIKYPKNMSLKFYIQVKNQL